MRLIFQTSITLSLCLLTAASGDSPLLKPHDRIAVLGGTFVERMQSSGALEAALHCRRPSWKLSVRNLGWSGDDVHGLARKRFDRQPKGLERLLEDVRISDPDVVLIAYGFAEASNGQASVARFEPGLRRLGGELGQPERRVVLIEPVATPGYRVSGYENWLAACRGAVKRVGKQLDLPVISVNWQPANDELVESRLLPKDKG